jgi:hypothetical protein
MDSYHENATKICWAGDDIEISFERAATLLDAIGEEATRLGFKRITVAKWTRESFGPEGSMEDFFYGKSQAKRPLFEGSDNVIAPDCACSLGLLHKLSNIRLNLTFAQYPGTVRILKRDGTRGNFKTGIGPNFHIRGSASAVPAFVKGKDVVVTTHREILDLLEAAQAMIPEMTVRDNSGYQRNRSGERLYRKIRDRLALEAYEVGRFLDNDKNDRDQIRRRFPIVDFPEFEALEMEGSLISDQIRSRESG